MIGGMIGKIKSIFVGAGVFGYLPSSKNADGSKKRVFVGVSGGVDSSVSAAILKDAGFDVTGVFIKVYHPDFLGCDWRDERADAISVCEKLEIPFLDLDLEKEYKEEVFDYMIDTYKKGETPNPDIFCNKYVKFGGFLDFAIENGADYVATGHYAKNIRAEDGTSYLHKGDDLNKDQTYFIYTLPQEKLKKVIFPIGIYPKSKVRKIAEKYDLFTKDKKDSQGLCFVGKVKMKDFLQKFIDKNPGSVLNENGEVIGSHDGAIFYTIGERHGFEIFPESKKPDQPKLFVLEKDMDRNTITVGPRENAKGKERSTDQNKKEIYINSVNWISGEPEKEKTYEGRVRYRGKLIECTVEKLEDKTYRLNFVEDHKFVSAGQSVVLYDGTKCIGGGIIIDK